MVKYSHTAFEIIELTHIPGEIERREEEKICLSNLILEFFRQPIAPFTEIELLCNSCAVKDQLHNGLPHFYIIMYLTNIEGFENSKLKSIMNSEIEALLCVLHRMGYMTTRYGTDDSIEKAHVIPSGLIDEDVWFSVNSYQQTEHQLLSTGIPTAFDNLIAMMADIPDSLFSILLRASGDQVGFNIQVFAKDQMQASLIYLNFVEGMATNYQPDFQSVRIRKTFDYWEKFRMNKNMSFPIIKYGELSNILQLPFGMRSGIPNTPQQRKLPIFEPGLINGEGVSFGTIIGSEKELTLPLQNKVTHMSVLGISGSGKSNFLLYYLNEMYNTYGIPFLVIDPVSTEYRKLKDTLKDGRLNVFTPGSLISPFEFNLFALNSENLTVREYKSVLKDFFRNSLNLFSPLDKLIDETIDTVFLENGWFDISTAKYLSSKSKPFALEEFIRTFDRVFEESKFTGNQKSIAASGKVRLNALRNYFGSVASMPITDILSTPTIVELGKLQSAEAKSTLLLYLLSIVKIYMMDNAAQRQKENGESQVKRPCLILVIDEAHSILEMQERGEGMNVAQRGVIDNINQLLLEFRKYGLSVVVADQRVSVLQDVLTNTHVQVIFKQIDPQGKQVAADIISLKEVEMLAEQKVGEAFVKHEKLEMPVQVKTPFYENEATYSDQNVMDFMKHDFWDKHFELTRPFMECKTNCPLKNSICNRSNRSIAANILANFLKRSNHTSEELREAAMNPENKTVEMLLKRFKDNPMLQRCLRVHLLQASKYAPKTNNNK